ncbi:MAG: LLM class flavin-dependent oxidoreductase [Tepidiformaceae bacterium]
MNSLKIGVHSSSFTAQSTVDAIIAAEKAGIECAWLTVGGIAPDPFAIFAAAAQHTKNILFGTSIVPTFPRHPLAMAQGALAVDSLAPGRLRLGVGPSHKPAIEGTWGIPFERPLEHLREYLTILRSILETGEVNFDGKRMSAHARSGGPTKVTLMASALRTNGFRLCGELADGAISWNCPLPYLRDVAVPALKEGAAKAGRPVPPLIAHVPVVVSEDLEAVRAGSQRQIGFYPKVPFYSQMLQDAGFPEAKDGELSNRMIDALVVHGSPDQVKARLRQLPEFGASELLAMPVIPPGDTTAMERTLEVLGELANE